MTRNDIIVKENNSKKSNPLKQIRNKVKVPYYYIPPCPRCKSVRTGRLMKYHRTTNDEYINKASLKNGELIKFVPEVDPDHDLFCADCGFTWSEYISVQWYTQDQIDEEKRKRGTISQLDDVIKEEKEEEKNQKHGIVHSFAAFIGKI